MPAPASSPTFEKDTDAGDADSYLYGGNSEEILVFADTATGDVNGDGIDDLVMGHDQGGTSPPYFYTGKVYIYYGRRAPASYVDLGAAADVTISGYTFSFSTGCSVACGDINGDGIDDIVIGAYLDTPGGLGTGPSYAGSVSVVFGSRSLPASWDFDSRPPDLYISGAKGGEMCGMSVAAGDIDGDGYDDILFGAHLGNGGVHARKDSDWEAQANANADTLYDVSMIDGERGWAVGRYISAYDTIYRYGGGTWSADTTLHRFRSSFYGVAALDSAHTWAVGAGGLIIFNGDYNDPGSWDVQGSGVTSSTLRDVAAADASSVWAVGDGGTILHYDGSVWSAQESGTTVTLRGVAAADASSVWAVGDGGTILHYDGSVWSAQ
ncbi:MAG: FG-GAP-like repeat-containing protein, partial [Actinomycetota bacterium]|nr:FG-GAP-like repeat-containing protein [Actinomycetota bacterium]